MDLKDLRQEMAKLLKAAQDLEYHQFIDGKVVEIPVNNPAVVVWHENKLISCWRKQKPDGAVEVVAITKSDRSDGPTARKTEYYMAKVAHFLENHGNTVTANVSPTRLRSYSNGKENKI